jgi:WD40 repeat protein
LADGAKVAADEKNLPGWSAGVWVNAQSSNALWLLDAENGDFDLAYGAIPLVKPDPKKNTGRVQWLRCRLPNFGLEGYTPITTANFDLTRVAIGGGRERQLSLYNIEIADELKLKELASVPSPHKGRINTLRFSPDGNTLATGSEDSALCLWEVTKAGKDWKPRATIALGDCTVGAIDFSPDGRTIAVGTFDSKRCDNLYIIEATAGKVLASYRLDGQLTALAYSPNGKTLVTGNNTGRIQTWDAAALRGP